MFVFNPSPSEKSYENISGDKSSIKDSRFGGRNQVVQVSTNTSNDYTKRSNLSYVPNMNPLEDVKKDIDDIDDSMSLKSGTKRKDDLINRKTAADASFIITLNTEDLLYEEISLPWKILRIQPSISSASLTLDWEAMISDWEYIPTNIYWDLTLS